MGKYSNSPDRNATSPKILHRLSHAVKELRLRELRPADWGLLLVLLSYSNAAGVSWPRVSTLATALGLSPRTVFRSLRRLEERGWLRTWNGEHYTRDRLLLPTAPPRPQRRRRKERTR